MIREYSSGMRHWIEHPFSFYSLEIKWNGMSLKKINHSIRDSFPLLFSPLSNHIVLEEVLNGKREKSRKQFQHDIPLKTHQRPFAASGVLFRSFSPPCIIYFIPFSFSVHPFLPVNWKEWKSLFSKLVKPTFWRIHNGKETKKNKHQTRLERKVACLFILSIIKILAFLKNHHL